MQKLAAEEIDLRQYWATIVRHKNSIIGLALVVTLATALVVFSIQPVYRATATLLIEPQQGNLLSIEEVYGLDTSKTEYYQTQFEILKSRQLAKRVIEKLNLKTHPDFDPDQQQGFTVSWRAMLPFLPDDAEEVTEAEKMQALIDTFVEKTSIEPIRKTHLVKLSFESHDADLAADAANSLADAYIESHLEARVEITKKATSWLTTRIGTLKENVTESERRLQAFREQESLIDLEGVRTLVAKELNELTSNLVAARQKRVQAENILSEIKSSTNLDTVPTVLNHPTIQPLAHARGVAETKIAELSNRYGPEHPKMLAAKSELVTSQSSINKQVRNVISSIRKEFELARKNEQVLTRDLEKVKKEVQTINRKEYHLRELEREAAANQKLYDAFFTRFQETNATQDLEPVNARLTDIAVAPRKAAKPKKALSVAIAFVVATILGTLIAFLLEHLNNTIRRIDDVEDRLATSLLGVVAKVNLPQGVKDFKPQEIFEKDEFNNAAESIRTIRTGLMLSGLDSAHKVTLITSSVPNEGKTTLSSSLAISLGQMEKVLLIDADMRRPSIGKTFNMDTRAPGLSNLVAGTETPEQCIHTMKDLGIDILPAGIIPPNPLELLSSEHFADTLRKLEDRYDRIVIDSPPVQAVSDSLVLATYANTVVYVVKADSTPYPVAKQGIGRLRSTNVDITGVVLNQLDAEKTEGYYGYYYGGDEYAYKTDKA